MEKEGFGRVRVYPKFEMSGSGISGIDKLGFGRVRVLKLRVRAYPDTSLTAKIVHKCKIVKNVEKVSAFAKHYIILQSISYYCMHIRLQSSAKTPRMITLTY